MIESIDINRILFLDIECAAASPTYEELDEPLKKLWQLKAKAISRSAEPLPEEESAALYEERGAIYAEFGKIICISVGIVRRETGKPPVLRLKSFCQEDEKSLLESFCTLLQQYYPDPTNSYLCGHNIKEFDIPYICRRLVVHQLPFPNLLQLRGKKPWETQYLLDTMEMWKFGDRKSFTSLNLLAAVLGFPSPKEDMDGSQVGKVYWEEKDLERIAHYCERDVLATVQLFLRYCRLPLIEEENVIHVDRT
ncbi:MAG: 3'-5' exonuclease [Bacteroidetes bacterium]|nr:MAG: 3'-5' exonuclease [Bacteroidota bacterium]